MKQEYESLTTKLNELSEDELKLVTGGHSIGVAATFGCDIECNLNPDTCIVKKNGGHCPKEGI